MTPSETIKYNPLNDKEVEQIQEFTKKAYRVCGTVFGVGLLACAAGGLINYIGGPHAAAMANKVIEYGLNISCAGGGAALVIMVAGPKQIIRSTLEDKVTRKDSK